jgi:hypothetical protein
MFTYMPPRFYGGANVTLVTGEIEVITKGCTLLIEGLLVDADDFGPEAERERFIPWVHIRQVVKRP